MKNFIESYNFDNSGIVVVCIESVITAFLVGVLSNRWWGLGAFIFIMVLYGFPVFAGVFSLVFSLAEAIIVYSILINLSTVTATWLISLFAFCTISYIHRVLGKIDSVSFGYSLIIFDALVISGSIYIMYKTPLISIAILLALLILAFVPVLRVIEYIVLTLGTTILFSELAAESLTTFYTFLVGVCVLLYTGTAYMYAYFGIDYKGYVQAKRKQKYLQERNDEIKALKSRLYNTYPELEKDYYNFYTEICQTDWDKMKFDNDWCSYLDFLDSSQEMISFNQYFDKEKLYKTSIYNRNFVRYKTNKESFEHQTSTCTSYDEIKEELDIHPEYFYELRESCMNKNESRAFYYLNCALDEFFTNPKERENYLVFPQMSLHGIFKISDEVKADYMKDKIAARTFLSKNIDFIICQRCKKDNYYIYRPLILIEIDGSSHYLPIYGEETLQRQKSSDSFKDNLSYSLGIPLLRYAEENDNITRDDRDKIKNNLFIYLKKITQ